jgi:hypothetical protein
MRIHPPADVIAAAREHIATIQRSEWLHLLGHHEYSMVPRLVSVLVECCLALEEFKEHEMLTSICVMCLLHTPSIRSRPPAGFVFHARPVLKVLLEVLKAPIDLGTAESSDMLNDLWSIRRWVEDDMLWKEGRLEMLQGFDELLRFGMSSRENTNLLQLMRACQVNPRFFTDLHFTRSPPEQTFSRAQYLPRGKNMRRLKPGGMEGSWRTACRTRVDV